MNSKITAVIPVRKGSLRCNNKNIRNFDDTNLSKRVLEESSYYADMIVKIKEIKNFIN